ncbi:MAG: hypothetical protein JOY85_00835 [Acidobacteriaceae bacterium]|nr:hypothetical protein [Acidobacteriaceae bacterium]
MSTAIPLWIAVSGIKANATATASCWNQSLAEFMEAWGYSDSDSLVPDNAEDWSWKSRVCMEERSWAMTWSIA